MVEPSLSFPVACFGLFAKWQRQKPLKINLIILSSLHVTWRLFCCHLVYQFCPQQKPCSVWKGQKKKRPTSHQKTDATPSMSRCRTFELCKFEKDANEGCAWQNDGSRCLTKWHPCNTMCTIHIMQSTTILKLEVTWPYPRSWRSLHLSRGHWVT